MDKLKEMTQGTKAVIKKLSGDQKSPVKRRPIHPATKSIAIMLFAYVTVDGCSVEFSVPGDSVTAQQTSDTREWFVNELKLDFVNLPGLDTHKAYKGTFSFTVRRKGECLTHQWVQINTLSEGLGDGTMNSPKCTPSVLVDGIIITYGFCNAGPGATGLDFSTRCYVYVTKDCSDWMGETAPAGSPQADKPFTRFVLPSAHDVGMNDTQYTDIMFENAAGIIAKVLKGKEPLFGDLGETWARAMGPEIAYGLAFTQKDDLQTMLAIGARYFEFHPAHIHKDILPFCGLQDKVYFQHGCIPGMAYGDFIYGCLEFLTAHKSEFIVVQIRFDGIMDGCKLPTPEELDEIQMEANRTFMISVAYGHVDDLGDMRACTIQRLRQVHKRLIIFPATDVLSTPTDQANAMLDSDTAYNQLTHSDVIINAYEKILKPANQNGKTLTNIQCQATASSNKNVLVYSVTCPLASTSCLMATKPILDCMSLTWIMRKALGRLPAEQLIVITNDFIDGATVDVAIGLSKNRLSQP